jgi:hypothetical protein
MNEPITATRANARQQRWKTRNPLSVLISDAKKRAKRAGRPFLITKADVLMPEHCPCCGRLLVKRHRPGRASDDSPSLDRVDNDLGYVPGNVRVICWRCNEVKRDSTFEELQKVIDYIKRHKETVH